MVSYFGMGAGETHVDDTRRITDPHHEPTVVALDVEDHPVAANDSGAVVLLLHLRGRIPILLQTLAIPGEQRFLGIRMPLPK